ncbi:MAG: glycosyltransferase [Methanobrevibacter sp.]|nr:glycosyltransferase [Methanobrevibacter sp.]
MRILHVVPSFAPCFAHGGVVNASYQIAKKQVEDGHEVTVYTTDSCNERLQFEDNYNVDVDGIKVFYFKNLSNNIKNKLTIDTPVSAISHIRRTIADFDIIQIHEHRHSLAIATHRYAKKNRIPYVLQAHGSVLPFFQKEKLKDIFDRLWGFDILHDASRVFALTEVEKEQYLKMGVAEDRIEIVPLGINLDEYTNLPESGNFKSRYGIDAEDRVILFLGRIHEIKGLDLLVNAFDKIRNDNVKLVIVGGDSGFKDTLDEMIEERDLQDRIIFPGVLTGRDKIEALVDCDVFVMPSRYESFTTSGLEAMACGKPLVLTRNNHIHTWVKDNVGLVCDFDEDDLSNCIETLLDNGELCREFGETGRKLIEDKYDWDKVSKHIESIYMSCF